MLRALNHRGRGAPRRLTTALTLVIAMWWTATASAQLDPLLFLRRVPPTIIIVLDTGLRMLEDGDGYYYDPNTYSSTQDPVVATALGVISAPNYRRKYKGLVYENVQDSTSKFEAEDIFALPSTAAEYGTFWSKTRIEIAKSGIDMAVSENGSSQARWGLIRLRQNSPSWRAQNNCDKPVRVTANAVLATVGDTSPCNAGGGGGRFAVYDPDVNGANYSIETQYGGGARLVAPGANTASSILTMVRTPIGQSTSIIPAGAGTRSYGDRPLAHALEDARAAAITAMDNDGDDTRACRNTVVVLITAGKDDGDNTYTSTHNVETLAATFKSVTSKGTTRRIPIHVVAIKPNTAHEAQLQNIAMNSGGFYRTASSAAGIARAIHYAVQAGYSRPSEFDAGKPSEYLPVSPVVGTVNLKNGKNINGGSLPNTDIDAIPGGQALPQRSNFLLTAGFALPGFDGVLRAFRTYVPEKDPTKPTGWKFTKDGTQLWPDIDGRPSQAGKARVPSDPNARNIYTYIPNGSGGGSVVAFTTANEGILRPHMNDGSSVTSLITTVRSLPLGALIGSTPAIMDVPSLEPPPDTDYGYSDGSGFAGQYKNRRAMIFFGANDGMIHAVDARTGFEVWAFIPYNLLPKLRTLKDGQPVETFDYFVDSSPKIAEVKINGTWKSLLFIGEGPGGTFYQAFDVTEAGMGVSPEQDDLSAVSSLLAQFDTPDESIKFKWSFPNYSSFDPTYTGTFSLNDGSPGGQIRMYGDLKTTATAAEKTVGFTWSDPAVGPLVPDRSVNALIVGSGYFPAIENSLPGRGGQAPKAGNALYLINPNTGALFGNATSCPTIASDSGTGTGCVSVGNATNVGGNRKNALQADPTAAGEAGAYTVQKAYLGDLDGKYWRFNFNASGTIGVSLMYDTKQPIYASSALLFIGTSEVYMFFATGSDILPVSALGGTGTFKLFGLKDNAPAAGGTLKFSTALATVTATSAGYAIGERPSASPSVAGDIVFYTTTTQDASVPCSDFTAKLYALTYLGGAAYDSDSSGKVENNESPVVATVAGRATAPFIVDQHLYFGTAGLTGANVEAFGDPEDFNNGVGQVGVRILSWREIR